MGLGGNVSGTVDVKVINRLPNFKTNIFYRFLAKFQRQRSIKFTSARTGKRPYIVRLEELISSPLITDDSIKWFVHREIFVRPAATLTGTNVIKKFMAVIYEFSQ